MNTAALIGVVLAAVATFYLQRRRNQTIAAKIEPVLGERGALTLMELSQALGMSSFFARGKVVMSLGELVRQGKVQTLPAPEGTPQLQKVDFIKYQLAR